MAWRWLGLKVTVAGRMLMVCGSVTLKATVIRSAGVVAETTVSSVVPPSVKVKAVGLNAIGALSSVMFNWMMELLRVAGVSGA